MVEALAADRLSASEPVKIVTNALECGSASFPFTEPELRRAVGFESGQPQPSAARATSHAIAEVSTREHRGLDLASRRA